MFSGGDGNTGNDKLLRQKHVMATRQTATTQVELPLPIETPIR